MVSLVVATLIGLGVGLSGIPGGAFWLFAPVAVVLGVYDLRERRIPEAISLPGLVAMLAAVIVSGWHVALVSIATGAILAAAMFALMIAVQFATAHEDSLGFGDVVSIGLLGIALGDPRIFTPLEALFAVLLGAGVGFLVEAARRQTERVPLGFWLLVPGAALGLLGVLGHPVHL